MSQPATRPTFGAPAVPFDPLTSNPGDEVVQTPAERIREAKRRVDSVLMRVRDPGMGSAVGVS